jgi:predicted CDP-diglyceride synthetase/phosphatidate cytidylyltransferase
MMAILSFMKICKFLQLTNTRILRWAEDGFFSSENKEYVKMSWAHMKDIFCLSLLQHNEGVR